MSLLRTIGTRVPAVAQIEQAIAHPSKRSYEQLRGVSLLLPQTDTTRGARAFGGRSQAALALWRSNAG
jgi:hypothetical protein